MLALKIIGKLILAFVSFFAFVGVIRGLFFFQIPGVIWLSILILWLVALVSFEVVWLWRKRKPFPRFSTHLQYAPLAVFLFSVAVTLLFDATMIQYSKYKIHSYIYSNVPPEENTELDLHNYTFRGMCCEGDCGARAWLYGETAREGFSSSDAAVRARSLRARMLIFDLTLKDIDQAEQDEDVTVRKLAARFRKGDL